MLAFVRLIITASFVLDVCGFFSSHNRLHLICLSVMDSASQQLLFIAISSLWSIAESNPIEGVSQSNKCWIRENT